MLFFAHTKIADIVEEYLNQHFLTICSFFSYVNFMLSNKLVFDIEDSKLEEILEKFISKTHNMLYEKFGKF